MARRSLVNPRQIKPDDVAAVRVWLQLREMELPGALPRIGRIVPGLAAGWLLTDGSVALLEPLVGNPLAARVARGEALDAVVHSLELAAREAGAQVLLAHTRLPAVAERARRLGWVLGDLAVALMKTI